MAYGGSPPPVTETFQVKFRGAPPVPLAGVVATEKIKYSKGTVEIKQTDGRSYAELRAVLHFDEYRAGANFNSDTFSVDEVTVLECKIDGDQMQVIADVNGRREDEPWFRAHWRTTFIRAPM